MKKRKGSKIEHQALYVKIKDKINKINDLVEGQETKKYESA